MKLLRYLSVVVFSMWLSGCATSRQITSAPRPFEFEKDTFAYANELVWEYSFDAAAGKTITQQRAPKPDYSLRCFVMVRSARQFFAHARFDASRPKADDATHRQLVERVLSRSPQQISDEHERIVIPGYAHLRAFSAANEALLKAECGGAWQSYVQRGNWRMVFPFSRRNQESTAARLQSALGEHWPPIVHVVRFPSLAINHVLLLCDYSETENEIQFTAYDPNDPSAPTVLRFDRSSRSFLLPRSKYFLGGRVSVYEIYRGAVYERGFESCYRLQKLPRLLRAVQRASMPRHFGEAHHNFSRPA